MSTPKVQPFSRIMRAFGLSILGTSITLSSTIGGATAGTTGRSTSRMRSARGSVNLGGPGRKAGKLETTKTEAATAPAKSAEIDLAKLKQGEIVVGFRADAVYLNDAGKAVGARFKHVRSAFTFDYLSVQTAPQAFMWVNTPPTSDMGEAHTQEHLLLGKGNKGRSVATLESMSMTSSTAMTMQWRTCYHFNTTAGADVFYEQVQTRLDALLNPDYTDEEVSREVRNFGVDKDVKDGKLKLEEKGTVYNEMVSNVKAPGNALWRSQYATLYGKQHPLYYMSGGSPAGLRELDAEGIRKFRKSHYVLSNMGMIAALPRSMSTVSVLEHLAGILDGLQAEAVSQALLDRSDVPDFPPPAPEKNDLAIVSYPEKDSEKPGSIEFFWPADLDLSPNQEMLIGLFLGNIAGDPATPLYKKFIDAKTRFKELGATGVWASASDDLGFPVSIGLSSVSRANINPETINQIRDEIQKELEKIAAWPDDSPELKAFNERMRDKLIATRRSYSKFVNSPPGFGNRWQGSGWMGLFVSIGRGKQFYRSVTMKPEIAFVEKVLNEKGNIWRRYLKDWRLTTVKPSVVATKADPQLIVQEEEATRARIAAETERLKKVYGTDDEQKALAAYKADYDKATVQLEELAKKDKPAHLVKSLPLTMDDQLEYSVGKIGNVPVVSSNFESMTGATAGLAIPADTIGQEDLLYLSFLPTMLNQMGLIVDGKPVAYEQLLDIFRREILSAGCSFTVNTMNDRFELVMRGSGNDPTEVNRAIYWMGQMLLHPDWRPENLPRIRDVVDQTLTGLRSTRQGGYEENWVHGVSGAYWRQDWPLYLATRCFLTRTHSAQRLRWLLKGDGNEGDIKAFVAFMPELSLLAENNSRDDLKKLLDVLQKQNGAVAPEKLSGLVDKWKGLSKPAADLVSDAAKDLSQDLADIPDDSLKADWTTLCAEIKHDITVPPGETLERFEKVRKKLITASGARLFIIGAQSTEAGMREPLKKLLGELGDSPSTRAKLDKTPTVVSRLQERLGFAKDSERPVYVGFVNPNTQQGVFLLSAPALKYTDTDEESLLRYLAFQQYAGGGAHSIFMKTWGAGLAYGNGLRVGPNERMAYYADKTPALPDTIKFVTKTLKEAPADLDLGEYAVARAFTSMAAQKYESRGESMAESLVDNEPPAMVKNFRQAILKLRDKPNLSAALHERMLSEYARLLPGLGADQSQIKDSVYMVLGDEKQMKLYEEYLQSTVGPSTKLYRVYGRDYWMFNGV